jgi:hypothetical protein
VYLSCTSPADFAWIDGLDGATYQQIVALPAFNSANPGASTITIRIGAVGPSPAASALTCGRSPELTVSARNDLRHQWLLAKREQRADLHCTPGRPRHGRQHDEHQRAYDLRDQYRVDPGQAVHKRSGQPR